MISDEKADEGRTNLIHFGIGRINLQRKLKILLAFHLRFLLEAAHVDQKKAQNKGRK